jgi:hypothetical protein
MAETKTTTKVKFTDRFLESMKPPAAGTRITYWDELEPGCYDSVAKVSSS